MLKKKGVIKLLAVILAACILSLSLPVTTMAAYSFNQPDVERCMEAFLNTHYRSGDIYTSHFWEAAYSRELLCAYYNLTGKNKDKISETFYWFEDNHTANKYGNPQSWIASEGDWNDDYSWQSQFTMSAYAITGDQHMLDQAKWHFDFFYKTSVDDTWGGGMWRERSVQNQKDVPTNGWAIVAAQLAKYYPDEKVTDADGVSRTYKEAAIDIYNWVKASFMRPDGGIENSITTGKLGWDDNLYTYNAGIFIELASYLYDLTKDNSYIADACKAADFAKKRFTTGADQIVVYEDDVGGSGLYMPDPTNSYEIVFRGILMRGIYKLITLGGQTQYTDWLTKNAQAAYNNRSGDDLTAPYWNTPYDGTTVRPTANATGLTLMCYSLLASQPGYLSGKVEAESGVKYGTAYKQADHAASGGYVAGSIDHAATETTSASAIEFKNCVASQKLAIGYCSGLDNPKLNLYINGVYSQELNFDKTGSWDGTYAEKIFDVSIPEGASIKIQYDDGCAAANIDYIRFISDAEADKSILAETINSAMSLSQNDYTPETWDLLQPAIDAALEVYNRADAVQAEVDTAVDALKAVVDSLVTVRYFGKVEAEKGKKYGTAYSQADSGASGGFMVGSIDHVGSAFELKNCGAATRLIVAYASGLDNPKLSFYINGVDSQDLTFTKTGGWGGSFAQKTFDVVIPEGATIKFQYDSGDVAANIDYIGLTNTDISALTQKINDAKELVEQDYTAAAWKTLQAAITEAAGVAAAIPTQEEADLALSNLQAVIDGLQLYPGYYSGKIEAEIGKMYGTAYKQADSYASGGFIAGSIDHVGAAFELIKCAPTNNIIIGYASGKSNPKLSLYINGVDSQDVTFTNTGGWNGAGKYAEKTLNVDIPAGASIKLQYDSGDVAANIDYIIIPADKTGLIHKISEVQALTEEDYTPESWSLLQTALNAAVSVSDNKGSTQEEVTAALNNLNAAINGLQVRPLQVQAPAASPVGGIYTSAQTVTLSSATDGASIYYTADGSEPTTASELYTGPITVATSRVIKAIAVKEGMEDSEVAVYSYTIDIPQIGQVQIPIASPAGGTYTSAQTVTLSSTTSGASIYFTADGSEPTMASELYTGPITVDTSRVIKAIAVKEGMEDSEVAVYSYTIDVPQIGRVQIPAASPAGGTYTSAQTVTLSSATSGANIYYTADGSEPTTASAIYINPIAVNASTVIKAIAVKEGMDNSEVATFSYTINTSSGGGSTPGGGQTGGGSTSGGSTPGGQNGGGSTVQETIITVTPEGNARIENTSKVVNGAVVNEISESDLDRALQKAVKAPDGTKTVIVEMKKEPNALKYVQKLPVSKVASAKSESNIKIMTPVAELTVPSNMIKKADAKDSKVVEIIFEPVNNNQLDKKIRDIIGNRPVINLYMAIDGKNIEWNNPLAPVKVSMEYTPAARELENPDKIVVYYIDGNNNINTVPNARYDTGTGKITFTTTHFSKYAVGYSDKTFSDVSRDKWYSAAIAALAAKGIAEGTSEEEFSPNLAISREESVAWLVRAFGLNTEANGRFDDTSDSRYLEEINIAKALGITNGVGDNRFAPEKSITRQDLMKMIVKAMEIADKGLEKGTKEDIAKFRDASEVSGYALDSVAALVKSGIIVGSGSNINPKQNITRAETAAILYKIYNK
ncbi:chitobiase/beta-hexosaminidase C-terminal domain-containing protein [Ruminiclostridium cellobioparum]|uniref:chitobiase/beta-hexosaminidase C-terminal domain-containing protein n=1 Tax=Ruminiclostridium cellobioparum TaxID=29355 RepID=UPI00068873CA|nr:chitobiase/beta-hexosaminidase C-terminal domain-containing protein [Ruminiclostridium cellobioparum]